LVFVTNTVYIKILDKNCILLLNSKSYLVKECGLYEGKGHWIFNGIIDNKNNDMKKLYG
jgi:hypothetical protein